MAPQSVRLVLSPMAVRDIEEIGDYIAQDNPSAAANFVSRLRARCRELAGAPMSGRLRPELMPNLRSVAVQRYVIFYTLGDREVRVERILHGARDIDAVFGDA